MPTKTFYRLRDEKQELIMRAAIHEFVENGFTHAKTGDIALNAGISKGSIFQYFENKKELFVYCAKWGSSRVSLLCEEPELVLFMQLVFLERSLLTPSAVI